LKTTKLKRAVIKEEFVAITGNVITALILNQMIYWSERIDDFDEFIEEEKARFENEGKEININLQEGWIYKSYQELKNELMLSDSLKTISRHLKKLVDWGFLDRRRNPNVFYDRKYQYRVNLMIIRNKLNEMGYELQGYKVEFSNRQNENSNCQIDTMEEADCPIHGQIDKSTGQNDKRSGQIDKPSGQNDKTIPEITTKTKTNINTKTTTTKEKSDYSKNLEQIESKFYTLTGKRFNSNDIDVAVDLIKYPLKEDVDIEIREKIIIDTLVTVTKAFKIRRPNEEINSLKYYYNAIIKEFSKLKPLRSDLGDSQKESNGRKKQEYIDEYGRKYDFTMLSSNRKTM
jgi:hypothetical protein